MAVTVREGEGAPKRSSAAGQSSSSRPGIATRT